MSTGKRFSNSVFAFFVLPWFPLVWTNVVENSGFAYHARKQSAAFHLPTSVLLPGSARLPNFATSWHLGFETSPLRQTSFQCKYLLLCYALKYFFYVI